MDRSLDEKKRIETLTISITPRLAPCANGTMYTEQTDNWRYITKQDTDCRLWTKHTQLTWDISIESGQDKVDI